jgi:hypothetical protein
MILEDSSSQAGLPLHKRVEGDAAAGTNAHAALVAKDASGNLIYLRTTAGGALIVDTGAAPGTCKNAKGELAAGSATLALVTGASISLANSKAYSEIGFIVSCRRDSLFQIVWDDNGSETILGEIVVGSGAYTVSDQLHCLTFTSGSTGTQTLKVKAKNFEALSSLRAAITALEA